MSNRERKGLSFKLKRVEKKARKDAVENREDSATIKFKKSETWFDPKDREEPGEKNWKYLGLDLHPQVTVISLLILVVFIVVTLSFPERSALMFQTIMDAISENVGWFFILAGNIFVVACLYFAFGRFGKLKIGGAESKPEFSNFAWYAMLLSAGMGIGLLFWSVAEPISHLSNPSPLFGGIAAGSPEAAQAAMATTFFHWGIHPWAIYSLVGLALAFFAFNRGLPLTMRSVFYPLIGNKIYGFWGNLVDILAVLATISGLATSLGLGVSQINAGLNHLFGISISTSIQILLIIVITAFAVGTVISGLEGGVKKLSEINMVLAGIFLLFILLAGPTVYILSGFTQNVGYYLANFVEMSTWTETFRDTSWQSAWTIFYWSWWISWSPFVGMFIARISKGRTIREFILGVMLIPSLISFIWMSVFGGTSIFQQMNGIVDVFKAVKIDESQALFAMLEGLPLKLILSVVAVVLITVFFVTSANSGALVVDSLTSGGKHETPKQQKFLWTSLEGVVAATLLIGGGLTALQTASVITGLPFAMILLIMIFSLNSGLKQEYEMEENIKRVVNRAKEDYEIEDVISEVVKDDALINQG